MRELIRRESGEGRVVTGAGTARRRPEAEGSVEEENDVS